MTGATGVLGGAVARRLRARGFRVRGLTRDPDAPRARALAGDRFRLFAGDLADPGSLRRALAGVHGVILVSPRGSGEADAGRRAVDAAATAGVARVVYVSTFAADPAHGLPGLAKAAVGRHLRESGWERPGATG